MVLIIEDFNLFTFIPSKATAMSSHKSDDDYVHSDRIPGTEILFDEGPSGRSDVDRSHLKHRTRGDARILLVPQPSRTDANDPLNWSTPKKSIAFFNGCWYAFMGAITGPIMAAGKLISEIPGMRLSFGVTHGLLQG